MEAKYSLQITLPAEMAEFLAQAVANGEYPNESEAVCAALRLLAEARSNLSPAAPGIPDAPMKRKAFTLGRMFGY